MEINLDKQYKVGILIESRSSPYGTSLRTCLEEEAQRRKMTIGFIHVDWADPGVAADTAAVNRTLQQAAHFDAVILASAVFSDAVAALSRFAQHWAPKPAVSIGYRLPGVASLQIDNQGSMRLAVSHLIKSHDRKEIIFIRGRTTSIEAEQRYLGFRYALRDFKILSEGRRILRGDFTKESAQRAMSELDDTVRFNAIVAANDEMALAAMAAVQKRGLRVPEDVVVLGFDDAEGAATAPVPLTSLAQPFADLASRALTSIARQATGLPGDFARDVPVQLIRRASCGC